MATHGLLHLRDRFVHLAVGRARYLGGGRGMGLAELCWLDFQALPQADARSAPDRLLAAPALPSCCAPRPWEETIIRCSH